MVIISIKTLNTIIGTNKYTAENIKGRNSQKILEDAFEAFLAAIFKDLGFDAVNSFVINLIDKLDFNDILFEDNYKDILLKYSQKVFKNCTPEYNLVNTDGPPHCFSW